jgi:hypothetical protein
MPLLSFITLISLSSLSSVSGFPLFFSLSAAVFAQGYGYDAGLRVGDRLVTVDGVDASKMNVEQVQHQRILRHSPSADILQQPKIEGDTKHLNKFNDFNLLFNFFTYFLFNSSTYYVIPSFPFLISAIQLFVSPTRCEIFFVVTPTLMCK